MVFGEEKSAKRSSGTIQLPNKNRVLNLFCGQIATTTRLFCPNCSDFSPNPEWGGVARTFNQTDKRPSKIEFLKSKNMKSSKFKSLGFLMLIALFYFSIATFWLGACTEEGRNEMGKSGENMGNSVSREAQRVADSIEIKRKEAAADLERERKELGDRIERGLDNVDRKLAEADANIKKASAKEKERWRERRKDLEAWKNDLENDMKELKSDTKREWKDFKLALADRLDKMEKKLEE